MYSSSGQKAPGPQTHSAQLRADRSGAVFRALEESLREAIDLVKKTDPDGRPEAAIQQLDVAFEAAQRILAKARSIAAFGA